MIMPGLGLALAVLAAPAGVVVVDPLQPNSIAERARLRPGDRIESWSQGSDSGSIRNPFDLDALDTERSPRADVVLSGSGPRGAFSASVGEGPWQIPVRPDLSKTALGLWERARSAETAGRHAEAADLYRRSASSTVDPLAGAWLRVLSGAAWVAAAEWERAEREYAAALDGTDTTVRVLGLLRAAKSYQGAGRRSEVRRALEEALHILSSDGQQQLSYARVLLVLGQLLGNSGNLDEAELLLERGLRVVEALAPESLLRADYCDSLGVCVCFRGETDRCEALVRQAYELRARRGPDTLLVARSLLALGTLAAERGDLEVAEHQLREALAIIEKVDPVGTSHALLLNNLGTVLAERGDWDPADDLFRRVLDLGDTVPRRTRSLAFINLALTALDQGRLDRSRDLLSKALDLAEGDEAMIAMVLPSLGRAALASHDLPAAQGYFERARSYFDEKRARNTRLADALIGLGDVAEARGDMALAASLYAQAAPVWDFGSFAQAEALARLGSLRLRAGDAAGAVEHFGRATLALESQRGRLGSGGENGFGRMAAFSQLHADYIDALLCLRRPADAFRVAESARARALLDLLAERDLGFARDIPAELDRERRRIDRLYDRVQATIAEAGPESSTQELEKQSAELRDLEQARLRVAAEIRSRSSRLAAFQAPRPLSLEEAQRALDPGTVLLSYVVGKQETFLFVVEHATDAPGPAPAIFRIPIGRVALEERVASFLTLLRSPSAVAGVRSEAESLYGLLVRPAQGIIDARARLLVSPDGPLQTLPFSALARPRAGARPQFLAEWRPVHYTASVTLYSELRKRRPTGRRPDTKLAAFGDPVYPSSGPLVSLPATRREAHEIARLFRGQVALFLGPEATEANAKALTRDTRYVHFACHALLNSRRPLDSALALTAPETPSGSGGNGLLQAWEIFEDVRVDADLVTLSACESGLGKDVGGEGLVGLTRAFQYAGAASVLASLWNVADESTADLMTAVYRKLSQGKPKDRALQEAQVTLIRRGLSPFHWAGFQLTGDWR